jgi:hypothetical protein
MVCFCYTGSYDKYLKNPRLSFLVFQTEKAKFRFLFEVYVISEKYGIGALPKLVLSDYVKLHEQGHHVTVLRKVEGEFKHQDPTRSAAAAALFQQWRRFQPQGVIPTRWVNIIKNEYPGIIDFVSYKISTIQKRPVYLGIGHATA